MPEFMNAIGNFVKYLQEYLKQLTKVLLRKSHKYLYQVGYSTSNITLQMGKFVL